VVFSWAADVSLFEYNGFFLFWFTANTCIHILDWVSSIWPFNPVRYHPQYFAACICPFNCEWYHQHDIGVLRVAYPPPCTRTYICIKCPFNYECYHHHYMGVLRLAYPAPCPETSKCLLLRMINMKWFYDVWVVDLFGLVLTPQQHEKCPIMYYWIDRDEILLFFYRDICALSHLDLLSNY